MEINLHNFKSSVYFYFLNSFRAEHSKANHFIMSSVGQERPFQSEQHTISTVSFNTKKVSSLTNSLPSLI